MRIFRITAQRRHILRLMFCIPDNPFTVRDCRMRGVMAAFLFIPPHGQRAAHIGYQLISHTATGAQATALVFHPVFCFILNILKTQCPRVKAVFLRISF